MKVLLVNGSPHKTAVRIAHFPTREEPVFTNFVH